MSFIDSFKEQYGQISEDSEKLIMDVIGKYSQKEQEMLKSELFKAYTIMPDTEKLAKFFDSHKPKTKVYFWSVCLECGCEYDYSLPMCPKCYEQGLDCRAKAIKKSEFQPNPTVIKYNKTYLNGDPGEQTCFTCPNKKESYCKNFGNPDWMCHREEYEMCECKQCCGLLKSANRKLVESSKDKKFSYAVPLKRCI